MTQLPREPSGDHPLVQTVRQIIRCLRERTVISDPSLQIERTSNGIRIKPIARSGGGGTTKDKPVWL
jgi:hypothetical protein